MTSDPFEILSAFVDGEETDASALADALAAPGARETLIDFVRLRVEIARDAQTPSPALRDSVEREMRRKAPVPRRALIAGAAAALLLVIAAGLLLRTRPGADPVAAPPPVQREVRFTEGVDWFRR